MADDPRLTQAYRGLPAEEPPPALDDAIRAAARRAVASRPRSSRWRVPVSIAAVLVLAFGIALQLEREQPILDDAPPAGLRSKPEAPATPEPKSEAKPPSPGLEATPPASAPRPAETTLPSAPEPVREKKAVAVPAAPPSPQPAEAAQPAFAPPPSPAADAARPAQALPPPAQNVSPAGPSAPAPPVAAPAAPVPGAALPPASAPVGTTFAPDPASRRGEPLRAAPGVSGLSKEEAERAASPAEKRRMQDAEPPEPWLERIAELRRQGRDAEADAAWAAFRRAYPGYRVPAGMLEKVQPR